MVRRQLGRDLAGPWLAVAGVLVTVLFATAAGAVAAPRITFYFGLKRPESRARAAFFAVAQPRSANYRRFLSLTEIAQRYGASPATRSAFLRDIRALGLSAQVDGSGVFARVTGTVAGFDRAFHARVKSAFVNYPNLVAYELPGHQTLRLPRQLKPLVDEVDASYAHSAFAPRPTRPRKARPKAVGGPSGPSNEGTWTRGCRVARATGAYSYGQVRRAYRIGSLGDGSDASVAILNAGEDVPAQDIAENARCFHYPALRTRLLRTDGQTAPFGRGTFEPQEDLALVRGMAPGLRSLTLTKAWADPSLLFLGASQVLTESRRPDTLSVSYGWCDRDVRGPRALPSWRAGASLMDAILLRLGLAGTATFGSAGDFGSSCNGVKASGVAWPGSSPYLTSVGGTRLVLDKANRRVQEVVWNDLRWTAESAGGGAGGGGFALAPRPPYQQRLGLPGDRRAVPDVAVAASSFPAYPVVVDNNWVTDAGTSAASPLVAGAFAIIDAHERARHQPPLGPVNGLLYYLRSRDPRSFYDIVSGDNSFYPSVPGWRAHRGYDLASGLGVPEFPQIAAAVPPAGGLSSPDSGLG